MKKYLAVNFLFINVLFGYQIDLIEAKTIAINFINERKNNVINYSIKNTYLDKNETINHFYILNLNPKGFILVSADNKVNPILGYSFNNNLNINSLPLQLQNLFESYKKNINYLVNNDIDPPHKIRELWVNYLNNNLILDREFREVTPLITANWNQGGQWNNMCPGDAYVGCVAVAMGQVMYYWNNPIQGNGYAAYSSQEYGPISVNFEDYEYDFSNMQDNQATPDSQLLLYHAGVAVHMDYSPWGSGASVCWEGPSAQDALINHFNFIEDTACNTRINYNNEEWIELIMNQLDNGWPIIYRGYGSGDGPGHAWNVDGYQEGGYLHCNWGWGGSSNGYFYFDELNGFIESQAVLINIFPQGIAQPVALFDYNIIDFSVTLSNLSMDINENQIVDWFWNFGDGSTSEEFSPLHTYTNYGSYNISLIVTDEHGQDSTPHIEVINLLDLIGDLNHDNNIDVIDVITLINLILDPEDTINYDADLNDDGMLSVIDIVLLINIILND